MRTSVAVRAAFMLTTVALGFTPAQATRTVIDSGTNMTTSGYCSPNGGCFPYALSPSLQLSGGPYSSYYINSNGVASFGSISGFLAAENVAGAVGQTSLSAFNVPVFSPYFSDGAGFQPQNAFDGNLVASTSSTGSGFIVNWYSCTSPIACGSRTIDLIASQTYSANPINPLLQNNIIAASTRPDKATASP